MTEPVKSIKYRTYPTHTLEGALPVARAIRDDMAGKPMNRLLLADALGIKPSSSNFRALLSSSLKYGLTLGTEKAEEIVLTDLGRQAVGRTQSAQEHALRRAAMTPSIFARFYADYNNSKVPSSEMLGKILATRYGVPERSTAECAKLLIENGNRVGIIRQISGSPHVILTTDDEPVGDEVTLPDVVEPPTAVETLPASVATPEIPEQQADEVINTPAAVAEPDRRPKAIFLGHGRKVGPREKLERILRDFKIPFAVAVSEPNLGKPIPTKVRETMMSCGSAILIFTKDQKFFVEDGDGHREVWRPSENVVHELGAASLLYEDRIVIFKERGIDLPSNFNSIGYIEFEEDGIEAKTVDLLKELIGFGLVTVSPVA